MPEFKNHLDNGLRDMLWLLGMSSVGGQLDLILVGPSQFKICYDSIILWLRQLALSNGAF